MKEKIIKTILKRIQDREIAEALASEMIEYMALNVYLEGYKNGQNMGKIKKYNAKYYIIK